MRTEQRFPPIPSENQQPARLGTGEEGAQLFVYLLLLRRALRLIALASAASFVATALFTKLAMAKSYRAVAIIRPVTQSAVQGRLTGVLLPIGGGLGGGLTSMLSGGANNDAEEYLTILTSYAFLVRLAEKHHLTGELDALSGRGGWLGLRKPADPKWRLYQALRRRFDCSYSLKSGNLTLYYKDRSRLQAEKVLGFYVDDLREKLRTQAIQDATVAVDSMKGEAGSTADVLLETQLYELVARQVQQKMLAEAQADFAFKVLEPPVAPDAPCSPTVVFDSVLMSLLTALLLSMGIILPHSPYGAAVKALLMSGRDG